MDDQFQFWQVNAAGCHIGGDAHPRPAISHRLKRMGAFALVQLTGQCNDRNAAIVEAGNHVVDRRSCIAEHQRIFRLVEAQTLIMAFSRSRGATIKARYSMSPCCCRSSWVETRMASRW